MAKGIESMAAAGVVPVLCPLVPLYLRVAQEAPARRMIEAGFPAEKIYYYRPGMQGWRMLGLTVTGDE